MGHSEKQLSIIKTNGGQKNGPRTVPVRSSHETVGRLNVIPRPLAWGRAANRDGSRSGSGDWTTRNGFGILGAWPLGRVQTRIHRMEQSHCHAGTAAGSPAAADDVAGGPVAECVRHPGGCISGSEDRQCLDRQLAGPGADSHRGKLGGGVADLLAGLDQASIERDHRPGHPEADREGPHERAAGRAGPRHGREVGGHQLKDCRRAWPRCSAGSSRRFSGV